MKCDSELTLNAGKVIKREDSCDNFVKRRTLIMGKETCWFCRYAWFCENGTKVPEEGLCKYPIRQTN